MTGFLSEGCEIITFPEFFSINMPNNNRYFLEAKGAHIEKQNNNFMFLTINVNEQLEEVSFQDCKKFLITSFIKDECGKSIRICNGNTLQTKTLAVKQEEKKELDSYFDFLKTLSFCEMEIYQKNFTDGIPTMTIEINQDNLPSKQTIINAMKKAQKAVEDIRNNKRENSNQLTNNTPTYTLFCNFGKNKYIGYDENGVWHCFCR